MHSSINSQTIKPLSHNINFSISKVKASTSNLHLVFFKGIISLDHWQLLSIISLVKLHASSSGLLIKVPPAAVSIMDLITFVTPL